MHGSFPLSDAETAALAARVTGPVLRPGEEGYARECATFNLLTPLRADIVVGAESAGDVQQAVQFAASRKLPISTLTTGHQVTNAGADSLLINLTRLNRVEIDAERRVARVEGGAIWRSVVEAAAPYGLAPISGSSPTVGVAGYHLGGGQSPVLGRVHGYAADHVQSIEVVTADGKLRRVTHKSNPDLFWALRGGKGNFGVVKALEFSLFPIATLFGGSLFFDGRDAASLLFLWRQWAGDLPPECSTSLALLRLPAMPSIPEPLQNRFVVHVRFSSLLAPAQSERLLAPIRASAPAFSDTMRERSYPETFSIFMDPPEPMPWIDRSAMLSALPDEAVDALLAEAGFGIITPVGFIEIRALGGALSEAPEIPNAVPGRSAAWQIVASAGGPPDIAPLLRERTRALLDALQPWTQSETAPNLLGAGQGASKAEVQAIYGPERYQRLSRIKAAYDPDNLFRLNHNIEPQP